MQRWQCVFCVSTLLNQRNPTHEHGFFFRPARFVETERGSVRECGAVMQNVLLVPVTHADACHPT